MVEAFVFNDGRPDRLGWQKLLYFLGLMAGNGANRPERFHITGHYPTFDDLYFFLKVFYFLNKVKCTF